MNKKVLYNCLLCLFICITNFSNVCTYAQSSISMENVQDRHHLLINGIPCDSMMKVQKVNAPKDIMIDESTRFQHKSSGVEVTYCVGETPQFTIKGVRPEYTLKSLKSKSLRNLMRQVPHILGLSFQAPPGSTLFELMKEALEDSLRVSDTLNIPDYHIVDKLGNEIQDNVVFIKDNDTYRISIYNPFKYNIYVEYCLMTDKKEKAVMSGSCLQIAPYETREVVTLTEDKLYKCNFADLIILSSGTGFHIQDIIEPRKKEEGYVQKFISDHPQYGTPPKDFFARQHIFMIRP